jgi:hypothetical protein
MSTQFTYPAGLNFQPFCDTTYAAVLAANSAKTITIPGETTIVGGVPAKNKSKIMMVYSNSMLWVSNGNTAAYPSSSSFASTTSEVVFQNYPFIKLVTPGDVISFIANSDNTYVNVTIYDNPTAT